MIEDLQMIDKMIIIRWWEWSHDKIMNNIELFYKTDLFLEKMDSL